MVLNMSFKDFIVDSIKYSIQKKTTFLVFGLLLVVLAFLPTSDLTGQNHSNLIISILISLITFILLMIQQGYLLKILIDSVEGSDIIPKFHDILFYIKQGIKELILSVYYLIIPFIILTISTEIPEAILGDFLIVLFILFVISLYLALLMFQTAILYGFTVDFKKAFNIKYIFKKSKEIGFKRLNFVLILSIIVFAIIDSIAVTNSNPIMSIILIIIGFILYPILAIVDIRYLALIGRDVMNRK